MTPDPSKPIAVAAAILLVVASVAATAPLATAATSGSGADSFTDSFEDEPADAGMPDNWEGLTASEDGDYAVTTNYAEDGSQSFYFNDTTSTGAVFVSPSEQPYNNNVTSNTTIAIRSTSGTASAFYLSENTNKRIRVRVSKNGYLQHHDGTGFVNITTANYNNEWVKFTAYNINKTADTHAVEWTSPAGSGSSTGLSMAENMQNGYNRVMVGVLDGVTHYDSVQFNRGASAAGVISGRVATQSGHGVADATVQVYGVNYSHPDITSETDAQSLVEQSTASTPQEFKDQLDSGFSLTGSGGHFQQVDADYAAVHSMETLSASSGQLSFWSDAADLQSPSWQASIPSGKEMMVSCWDPSQTGGLLRQSEYDRQLPGSHKQDCTVVVEQLAGPDSVDTKHVKINKTNAGDSVFGITDPSQFHYGTVSLPAGWYRVHPEGSQATGYVIQVGDPAQAVIEDLADPNGTLVGPAQTTSDALTGDKFVRQTAVTGPNGRFSVATNDSNVEYVAIQAYKAPGVLTPPDELTLSDIRYAANSGDLEGSIYLPSRVYREETPVQNTRIEVREVTHPQYADLSDYFGRLQDLLDAVRDDTFSDLPSALQQSLDSMPRSELENTLTEMQSLCEKNPDLNEKCEDNIRESTGNPTATTTVNPGDASDSELKERVNALQQSLTELQQTVDSGEPTSETGDETVSLSFPFDTDIDAENILVRAHFNNGSSTTLSVDSEYVSVDNRAVRSDVVKITDYPLGQGDAAVADFEVDVATSDGTGTASKEVKNPTFSGEIPSLKAVEFSTLRPGPAENVSIEVHPEDAGKYDKLVGATVYGPQGSELATSNITNGRQVAFDTNGAGAHRVELTFTNPGGTRFTEVVYVKSGQQDREWPASVRVKSGPTGVFTLVGDGLSSGEVDVKTGGSEADISAVIPQQADAPNDLHVYTEGLDTAPDTTTVVSVVRGEQQAAVQKHVPVTVHAPAVSEDALFYRNGEPLPRDGNQYGKVVVDGNQTRYETITDNQGTVTVRASADPGWIERIRYSIDKRIPDVELLGFISPVVPTDAAAGAAVGGLALVGSVAVGRRE